MPRIGNLELLNVLWSWRCLLPLAVEPATMGNIIRT
jgi:hypothetical protein